jgi:(p)ppGpp synthase/HD superfamily hydrolase
MTTDTATPWSQDLYLRALAFAARHHGGQTVPGSGFPYVVHLASVAQETMAALCGGAGRDGDLAVAAALLHDTVEDAGVTPAMVEAEFGPRVREAVEALSKNPALPKAEAMADSLERIRRCPPEVWMVKMADRIVNLGPPPPHWTAEKIAAYRAEAGTILDALGAACPRLAGRLARRIAAFGA